MHPTQGEFHEFSIQGHTGPRERTIYKVLVGMGVLLSLVCFVLELTLVADPNDHGFFSLFGLVGLGITTVFGYILKHAKERGH
jgi:hypothetical protein